MCKFIELSNGDYTIVDDEDYECLNEFNWYFSGGYAARRLAIKYGDIDSYKKIKTVYMHRIILEKYNMIGNQGDHINGFKLDNRKKNLRPVTSQQNSFNSKKCKNRKSSQYKGVNWYSKYNKWRSRICFNGKSNLLGYYESEIEAALSYDVAAIHYFGEYARLNFPKEIKKDHILVGGINCDRIMERKNSKFYGLHKDTRYDSRFTVEIRNKGQKYYLGTFYDEIQAAIAHDHFVMKNGLNKKLNFKYRKIGKFFLKY